MVPLSRMNPSCVILITGETWKAKLFVASSALYESQWTELLYFCICCFIFQHLCNKTFLSKKAVLKSYSSLDSLIHAVCVLQSTLRNCEMSAETTVSPVAALLPGLCFPMQNNDSFCS